VLFLHGFADSWHSFELVLAHLPNAIHAFALTQRGHGDASYPATGYRVHDFAADLWAFVRALNLQPAVIVGASSGGFAARHFAIEHADHTRGLALWGSPATLHNKPGVVEWWDSTISKLTDPVDPEFVRKFQASTLVQAVPPAFFEMLVKESLKVPAHVWSATLKGLLEDDSLKDLSKITAPTLIGWGDRDSTLPRSDQELLVQAIPGARLLIYPGAGHTFYWEEPARAASDLVAFIQGLDRERGMRRDLDGKL
jgi:pimeloyl-ACP methyl ester carboxylesterase